MRKQKSAAEEMILYSEMFSRGMYRLHPKEVWSRIESPGQAAESSVLWNILTEEKFHVRLDNARHARRYHEFLIRHPADSRYILWPLDVMEYAPEVRSELYTLNHYSDKRPTEPQMNHMLLFPAEPEMRVGCDRILEGIPGKNWKQEEIRRLAAGILRCFDRINRDGYLYFDIHFSRFLTDSEKDELFLDFSGLIFPADGKPHTYAPLPGVVPVEFAHPDLILGNTRTWESWQQNYSLTAMLFYLFIGRYAYDGRLMEGYPDDTMQNHYIKFRDYHRMPVFIFDEEDHSNHLGRFSSEQRTIALWEELPGEIRKAFTDVLCVRTGDAHREAAETMTPARWLALLEGINE